VRSDGIDPAAGCGSSLSGGFLLREGLWTFDLSQEAAVAPQEVAIMGRGLLRTVVILGLGMSLVTGLAACEGGYVASGSRESSRISGQGGWVESRIRSANGSATQGIELDGSGLRLDTEVTLEVEEGTFTIELLDGEGNVTLALRATPGNPASGRGYMEVDFDEAQYRVTAEEAKGVYYRMDFAFVSE
jgi:hypothetical protein